MMAICTGGGGSDLDVLMVMLEKATKALVIVKPMILIAMKTVNRVWRLRRDKDRIMTRATCCGC